MRLLSALSRGSHDLLVRIISKRVNILSSLWVVLAISCLGLGVKLVFASGSFRIKLDAVLLTSMSGALFAFSTYALDRAFQIANPEYGSVASSTSGNGVIILGRFFLKEPLVPSQWGAVGAVFGGVAFLVFSAVANL